jgi:hypothetical protein
VVLDQGLELYRELGDRSGQAAMRSELAEARRLSGDYAAAAKAQAQAQEKCDRSTALTPPAA